jgi:glutamate--cysteine ligase
LLIPENHTRNLFYLQNVARLAAILRLTGLEVRLGSLLPEIDQPTPVVCRRHDAAPRTLAAQPANGWASRASTLRHPAQQRSLGRHPGILQHLDEQFVLPPLHAGWALRRKSNHFAAYDEVAGDFARLVGIDPWRINPYFSVCDSVNFHQRQGEDCLAANVDAVLELIREKYRQYGIDETPYVVVKADAGTYGMGVMTVKDASQVTGLSRRQRNKMSVIKEGLAVSQVIIQEGCTPTSGSAAAAGRGRRTGGLHDRPLCRRRFLPRA